MKYPLQLSQKPAVQKRAIEAFERAKGTTVAEAVAACHFDPYKVLR